MREDERRTRSEQADADGQRMLMAQLSAGSASAVLELCPEAPGSHLIRVEGGGEGGECRAESDGENTSKLKTRAELGAEEGTSNARLPRMD
jgi:hypothetical protein